MQKSLLLGMLALFVSSCGTHSQINETSNHTTNDLLTYEAVINQPEVIPTNAGINPNFRALKISATFQLGSNACHAQGRQIRFVEKKESGRSILVAEITEQRSAGEKFCPAIFLPVFKSISYTVFSNADASEEQIVRNVEKEGVEVPLKKLVNVYY